MANLQIKAVILDLDQTLTIDQGSWTQFTQLLGADVNTHWDIFNKFRSGNLPYTDAKTQLIELWKSVSVLDRKSILKTFEKIKFRDGAFESVQYLASKYKLCIISGAIDLFVNVIADKLGITDRYSATSFIFNTDDILTDFTYQLSRGEEKVGFLNDFCLKYSISPQECAAIGDGESDMPIFQKVALPILYLAEESTRGQKDLIENQIDSWDQISSIL